MRRVLYLPATPPVIRGDDGAAAAMLAYDLAKAGLPFIVTMPDDPYAVSDIDPAMLDKCIAINLSKED